MLPYDMTGSDLIAILAQPTTLEQVRRLLGVPDEGVTEQLRAAAANNLQTSALLRDLMASQAQTDATVKELGSEVRQLGSEVKELSSEVKELSVEVKQLGVEVKQLATAQAETSATVKELGVEVKRLAVAQAETSATVKELAAAQAETSATVKELATSQRSTEMVVAALARESQSTRQELGSLSDNVGYSLEELARIIVPDALRAHSQVTVEGLERRFVLTSAGDEELDLYAEGSRNGQPVVVVGEVKSRIYRADVRKFAERVARLGQVIPQPLVPVMLGFVIHPSAEDAASESGILVVASQPTPAWKH